MAFDIRFAGFTLEGVQVWEEPFELKIHSEEFPRRHGSIVQKVAFIRPKRIVVTGYVAKSSESVLKTYLEDLKQKFLEEGRDKLQLRDDNRYLNAILSGFGFRLERDQSPLVSAVFTLEFFADDPFWYDINIDTDTQSAIASSPHTYSLTNSGKSPTPPTIEIKAAGGDATDVKVTNTTTSLFVRFAGTITNGQTLIIDHEDRTVDNSGANGMNDFTGSFWELVTGVNNLEYTGPTGVDVTVSWTKRYA